MHQTHAPTLMEEVHVIKILLIPLTHLYYPLVSTFRSDSRTDVASFLFGELLLLPLTTNYSIN